MQELFLFPFLFLLFILFYQSNSLLKLLTCNTLLKMPFHCGSQVPINTVEIGKLRNPNVTTSHNTHGISSFFFHLPVFPFQCTVLKKYEWHGFLCCVFTTVFLLSIILPTQNYAPTLVEFIT
jgi:hypothetical protein